MNKRLTVGLLALLVSVSVGAQNDIWRTDSVQEVVVTGTGTQHLLKDAPVQTEVISRKMLDGYGGSSIEDILGGLTSSLAFNEGDMGSQMQLNGLGNSYILILVNGRRLHGDNGGENDLQLIDPQNIEKIEIVKGASSALYGSDAIAGVINIITKRHDESLLAENKTRVGSYGDVRQHNGFGFTIGRLSSYTNFQLQHSDGWQNTSREDPRQTEFLIEDSRNKTVNRFTNWQLAERLTYQPLQQLELYAEGTLYRKRIYRPQGSHPGVDIHWYDLRYNNASANAGGKWKLNAQDYLSLDMSWNRHAYYYDFTQEYLTDGYRPDGTFTSYYPYFPGDEQLQSDQQRTMAELKGVFTLPYENRFSAGLEYRYDWLKAPTRVEGGKASDKNEALYIQDEFNLTPSLHITAGLRLNHNESFGTRLTPKLSAMLKAGEYWRLRATWSQGFKSPTPKELHYRYIRQMNGTYLYLGNEKLKPQTSNYFGASGEYTRNGLNLTVSTYINKVERMIALVTIPNQEAPAAYILQYDPIKTRQYQNMEDARTIGADISLRYTMGDWTGGIGYSYLDTEAHQYDTDHDQLQKVTIDGMAHHKGNLFLTWMPKPFGIGLYGRFSSKRYYQINGDGKGYQIWRLTGRYEHHWLLLEAGVDNIFNYCDQTDHGLHLGTTTPGRTVYASVAVQLNKGKKRFKPFKYHSKQSDNEEN